jgi:hypothetical protein
MAAGLKASQIDAFVEPIAFAVLLSRGRGAYMNEARASMFHVKHCAPCEVEVAVWGGSS